MEGTAAMGPGRAKTRAFNLVVESSSQFGQSENQKCWRRLSEEGNRETSSTLSSLAHVFTRPGSLRAPSRVRRGCPGGRRLLRAVEYHRWIRLDTRCRLGDIAVRTGGN